MVFYVRYILNVETDTSSRYSYLCFYSLYDLVNIHLFHDASNIVAMQRVSIAVLGREGGLAVIGYQWSAMNCLLQCIL